MNKTQSGAFRSVGIVGAGLMGTGIAEVTALAGFPTTLVKATSGSPEQARSRIQKSMARRVERGKLDAAAMERGMSLLTVTDDRDALRHSELVIESIVEDLEEKRALFSDLDRRLAPAAVFASNTSTLRIDALAGARPDRTMGMHFFSPVPAMSLVEVAHLPGTAPGVLEGATGFVSALGKTPVAVCDSTGFIVNRLLVPYLIGAIAAYGQGLARAEEIDTAMKLGCGHPLGPLALSDLIGLDVVFAMAKLLYRDFGDSRYAPPAVLRRLVQQGHLGKKTGLGFYDYASQPPRVNEELWALVRGGASALDAA
jgi:3-hydroxybutyryl-CoA dehydrogenase